MTIILVPAAKQPGTTADTPSWVQRKAVEMLAEVESELPLDETRSILDRLLGQGMSVGLNKRHDGSYFSYVPCEDDDVPDALGELLDWMYSHEEAVIAYLKKQHHVWSTAFRFKYPNRHNAAGSPVYHAYIQSFAWRLFRQYVLLMADKQCAECEAVGVTLQVHHISYQRIGCEMLDDVQLLCVACHGRADEERKAENRDRGLQTWADKVYGRGWEDRESIAEVTEDFEAWKTRKAYNR